MTPILNGAAATINNRAWPAQNASKSDSLLVASDGSDLIFRARTGENCASCGDGPNRVRSEIYSRVMIPAGVEAQVSSSVKISGKILYGDINCFLQPHGDNTLSLSPPAQVGIAIDPKTGAASFVTSVCFQRPADQTSQFLSIPGPAYTLGVEFDFWLSFIDSYGQPGGKVLVIINGQTIASYSGPTGFANAQPYSTYLKAGIHYVLNAGPVLSGLDQTTEFVGLKARLLL